MTHGIETTQASPPSTPAPATPPTPTGPHVFDLPVVQSALGLQSCIPTALGTVPLDQLVLELQTLLNDPEAKDLEDRLATQARLLDGIFTRTVTSALGPGKFDEDRLKIALKAQRQCRTTATAVRQMIAARIKDNRREIKKSANELMRPR